MRLKQVRSNRNSDLFPTGTLVHKPELSSVTVVIPTYNRPDSLIDCVRSISAGERRPNEIIVVGREDDLATKNAVVQAQSLYGSKTILRTGWVRERGHLPPVQKGLELAAS